MPNWYFDDKMEEIRELANDFLRSKDFFKTQKKLKDALAKIATDQKNACEKAVTESNIINGEQLLKVLSAIRNAQIQ